MQGVGGKLLLFCTYTGERSEKKRGDVRRKRRRICC